MSVEDTTTEIARSIVSGSLPSSESAVWAARRHLDLLKHSSVEGSEFNWDPEQAEHLFEFCEDVILTDAGVRVDPVNLELDMWQRFLFGQLIGWQQFNASVQRNERKYKELYYCKQDGRTELQSLIGLALYCFLYDKCDGKEYYLILDRPSDVEYARTKILRPTWIYNNEKFPDFKFFDRKTWPMLRINTNTFLEVKTVPGPLSSHPRMIIGHDLKRVRSIARCLMFQSDLGKSWDLSPIFIMTHNRSECQKYCCNRDPDYILSVDFG